jgi:hypothetical protein
MLQCRTVFEHPVSRVFVLKEEKMLSSCSYERSLCSKNKAFVTWKQLLVGNIVQYREYGAKAM